MANTEVQILRPSRLKWWLNFGLAASMALTMPFIFKTGEVSAFYGWSATGMCAFMALVFLLNATRSHLRLDPDGFTVRTMFHDTRIAWRDIAEIGAHEVDGIELVFFNFVPEY